MSILPDTELRTLPGLRAVWACTRDGFGAVIPLTGQRIMACVGRIPPGRLPPADDRARAAMRSLVSDLAMVEGYDGWPLLHSINAALARRGLGRLDALALIGGAGIGVPASVSGAGHPAPLIVTGDHLSAPVGNAAPLAEGWTVVLGADQPHGGPFAGLLSPEDVRQAIAILDDPAAQGVAPDRSLVAVAVAAGR